MHMSKNRHKNTLTHTLQKHCLLRGDAEFTYYDPPISEPSGTKCGRPGSSWFYSLYPNFSWCVPEPRNINAATSSLHHSNHCPNVNISSSLGNVTQLMFLRTMPCWFNIPMLKILKPSAGRASTSKPADCSIESAFCRPHIIPELLQIDPDGPDAFEVKASGHPAVIQIPGWSNL